MLKLSLSDSMMLYGIAAQSSSLPTQKNVNAQSTGFVQKYSSIGVT